MCDITLILCDQCQAYGAPRRHFLRCNRCNPLRSILVVRCDVCEGRRIVEEECDECAGAGIVVMEKEDLGPDEIDTGVCPECNGRGRRGPNWVPCPECNAVGYLEAYCTH
jgi:DnaJ-class molecular chaperone